MFRKIFSIIFIFFFLFNVYALTENEAKNFAFDSYLISPLDNETITSSTKILSNLEYWVLETSNNQILIIQDKNDFIFDETYKIVLKTYLYFLNFETFNTYDLVYFYNSIPRITNNFNYNIDLAKAQLQQESPDAKEVITGLTNIQIRTKDLVDVCLSIAKTLNDLEKYSEKNSTNISSLNNISKDLETNIEKTLELLNLLDESILKLKIDMVDANISYEAKSVIGNNILVLPKELQDIPKYNSEVKPIILKIKTLKEYSENIDTIDKLLENWIARKDKTIFLKPYFDKNEKIRKENKGSNAKELFEIIIKEKAQWKNQEETNIFINKYNEMITDYDNKNYKSAARQIPTLIDFGLALTKQGYLDVNSPNYQNNQTIIEDDNETKYNIYWIIAIGLVIVLITLFVIDYIKKHKTKTEKNEDKKINIDF